MGLGPEEQEVKPSGLGGARDKGVQGFGAGVVSLAGWEWAKRLAKGTCGAGRGMGQRVELGVLGRGCYGEKMKLGAEGRDGDWERLRR